MSAELDAFHEVEALSDKHPGEPWCLQPGEMYQPFLAKDGVYSRRLNDAHKAHPKTTQGCLDTLRHFAGELISAESRYADRIPLLRAKAQELKLPLRDGELSRILWDARRQTTGTAEPITQADEIELSPTPWRWDGLIMSGTLNLLVSLPKVGKTSLLLAWIAAWHRGQVAFLDRELIGPCPPVLIVGTDQPMADWGRMMLPLNLISINSRTRGRILPPIVALHHAGRPLHLYPAEIERIAIFASKHPDLLIVLDSLAACMRPLGIAEESADFAGPIGDLMEAVEPFGATVVAIHHSNKGRAGESATMASRGSRGSTALPAVASQIIKLSRLANGQPGATDRRLVIETEGRGGMPLRLLIERTEAGDWISHGDAEAVTQAQHFAEQEDSLNDGLRDALEAVRDLCSGQEWATAAQVADRLGITSTSADRTIRRRLDSIAQRGLLVSELVSTRQAQQKRYRPAGEVRTLDTPTPADVSAPSAPSGPLSIREDPGCVNPVPTVPSPLCADSGDAGDGAESVGGMRTV
ncbi:MAG: AAA family ATPase [Cyanobacteriota bacterium]|nr:AAA family ATPase [Cyanobacteriota bacterium]